MSREDLPATEYCAAIATPATFAKQLAFVMRAIEEHDCDGTLLAKWRCDPLPGGMFQIHASWPCGGAR